MKQFEVWWANLSESAGRRPVLLLSRDGADSYLNKFIVAEITTTFRSIPMEVQLGTRDGLPSRCAANLDSVQTFGAIASANGSPGCLRRDNWK